MRVASLTSVTFLLLAACSGEDYPTLPGTGGTTGNAGQSNALGGGPGSTNGGSPSSGGASGGTGVVGAGGATAGGATTGGATTGGATAGGASAGGAKSASGGSPSGGSNSGGRSNSGGASSGGANSGGRVATGGSGTGGSNSGTGGAATLTYSALCSMCHGAKGEGIAQMGPEIQHPVRDFATWVVRNGRQGHPSFPKSVMAAFPASALPDATLNSFFDALSTPALPKPTTGAALFADYCANCHGATGAGGPAGHDAKGETLAKALSMVRAGHSLTQFSSRTGYMPKWSTTELTDAEVGLIVTYLNSL